MSENQQDSAEVFIQLFTDDYFEKLYYFCLKKVSDANEAEDLAADIAGSIVQALRQGAAPVHFSAWVWKIARNKYSVWADKKRKRVNTILPDDINSLEIADGSSPDDGLMRQEDIQLLRRELAFIASEYRNVVVAYYIEYRKINDIAASLNLPVGTVKAKLFRSRNILKEGMNMAREFGALSYKPEDVGFIMNGSGGANGEPWSIIGKKLNKNILLAAYRTPSTAEELAVEIGMALPYMEDELEAMVQSELMRKKGKKYETNFFIVSAKTQEKVYTHLREVQAQIAEKIIALLEHQVKSYNDNGFEWHEGYQPYEDMKWSLLMNKIDEVERGVLDDINTNYNVTIRSFGRTKRPNGGAWDLLGLEEYRGDRPAFIGQHGCIHGSLQPIIDFAQFKFSYKGIEHKTPQHLAYTEGQALVAVAQKDTSGIPWQRLDKLTEYGYLEKTDGGYKPTFRVTFKSKIGELTAAQKERHDALYREAYAVALKHYDFCRELIYREIPDFLKDDQYQIDHACANIFMMRGAVLEGALAQGYIHYADDDDRKMLGAYLIIH